MRSHSSLFTAVTLLTTLATPTLCDFDTVICESVFCSREELVRWGSVTLLRLLSLGELSLSEITDSDLGTGNTEQSSSHCN